MMMTMTMPLTMPQRIVPGQKKKKKKKTSLPLCGQISLELLVHFTAFHYTAKADHRFTGNCRGSVDSVNS
jgi:hypothetical protein